MFLKKFFGKISQVNLRDNDTNKNSRGVMMSSADWDKLWRPTIFSLMRKQNNWSNGARSAHVNWIDELLQGIPGDGNSILELGCGTGLIIRGLYEKYDMTSGMAVDFSKNALAIACANFIGTNIQIVQTDIIDWNCNEQFDLVVSVGLIEHFQGDMLVKVIKKHSELLKPNGKVVMIFPRRGWLWPLLKIFNRIQKIIEEPLVDTEIEEMLNIVYLRIVRNKHYLLGMLHGIVAVKK